MQKIRKNKTGPGCLYSQSGGYTLLLFFFFHLVTFKPLVNGIIYYWCLYLLTKLSLITPVLNCFVVLKILNIWFSKQFYEVTS